MKVQIKIFYSATTEGIESQVNSFLKLIAIKNLVEVRFSCTVNDFNVMIVYKEKMIWKFSSSIVSQIYGATVKLHVRHGSRTLEMNRI